MSTALSQPCLSAGKGLCGVSAGNICSYKCTGLLQICALLLGRSNALAQVEVCAFFHHYKRGSIITAKPRQRRESTHMAQLCSMLNMRLLWRKSRWTVFSP